MLFQCWERWVRYLELSTVVKGSRIVGTRTCSWHSTAHKFLATWMRRSYLVEAMFSLLYTLGATSAVASDGSDSNIVHYPAAIWSEDYGDASSMQALSIMRRGVNVAINSACSAASNCASVSNGVLSCPGAPSGICYLTCNTGFVYSLGGGHSVPGTTCVECNSDFGCTQITNGYSTCLASSQCSLTCDGNYIYSTGGGALVHGTTCVEPQNVDRGGACVSSTNCLSVTHGTVTCPSSSSLCTLACTAPYVLATGTSATFSGASCMEPAHVPLGSACAQDSNCNTVAQGSVACVQAACKLVQCAAPYVYSTNGGSLVPGTTCVLPVNVPLNGACLTNGNCAQVSNGVVSCQSGKCSLYCNPYFVFSNGGGSLVAGTTCLEPSNVALGSACISSTVCVAVPHGTTSCTQGICSLACQTNYLFSSTGGATIVGSSCVEPTNVPLGSACISSMDCSAVTHGHVSCVQGLCNLGCTNPYVFRSNGGSGTTCVEPSRVAVGGGCVSSANCAAVSRGDVSCLGAVCVLACHAPYVEGGENMCVEPTNVAVGEECIDTNSCGLVPNGVLSCVSSVCNLACKTGFVYTVGGSATTTGTTCLSQSSLQAPAALQSIALEGPASPYSLEPFRGPSGVLKQVVQRTTAVLPASIKNSVNPDTLRDSIVTVDVTASVSSVTKVLALNTIRSSTSNTRLVAFAFKTVSLKLGNPLRTVGYNQLATLPINAKVAGNTGSLSFPVSWDASNLWYAVHFTSSSAGSDINQITVLINDGTTCIGTSTFPILTLPAPASQENLAFSQGYIVLSDAQARSIMLAAPAQNATGHKGSAPLDAYACLRLVQDGEFMKEQYAGLWAQFRTPLARTVLDWIGPLEHGGDAMVSELDVALFGKYYRMLEECLSRFPQYWDSFLVIGRRHLHKSHGYDAKYVR